jgi:hypothetical protein
MAPAFWNLHRPATIYKSLSLVIVIVISSMEIVTATNPAVNLLVEITR